MSNTVLVEIENHVAVITLNRPEKHNAINFDMFRELGEVGEHLKSIGIKSIIDQKDITYIAFTDILFNIFKIKRKINEAFEKY